jgi:hypothetical protein
VSAPTCHCGASAVLTIRITPYPNRPPLSHQPCRDCASGSPHDHACCFKHADEVKAAGVVLKVTPLGEGVVTRTLG